MRIADMLARGRPSVSFEFMAPRDEAEVDVLERTVEALAGHAPDWVSVTYRARTGDKTLALVTRSKRHYHIEAVAHPTGRVRSSTGWSEKELPTSSRCEVTHRTPVSRSRPPTRSSHMEATSWHSFAATAIDLESVPHAALRSTRRARTSNTSFAL